MKFDQHTLIIILVVIFALWFVWPSNEGFGSIGSIRPTQYGLRGEPLRTSSIAKYYISPNRQIRLSQTHNEIYEADRSPPMQGEPACKQVGCPKWGYDNRDTCWTCNNFPEKPTKIPDIWPHVPI